MRALFACNGKTKSKAKASTSLPAAPQHGQGFEDFPAVQRRQAT
jgi:hypothetical protein